MRRTRYGSGAWMTVARFRATRCRHSRATSGRSRERRAKAAFLYSRLPLECDPEPAKAVLSLRRPRSAQCGSWTSRLGQGLRPLPDPGRFERLPRRQGHRVVAGFIEASCESRCAGLKPNRLTVRIGEIGKGHAAAEPQAQRNQESPPIHCGTSSDIAVEL